MVSNIALILVATLHIYFLVLEMFLWTKPFGMKTFGLTPETARSTASLAANQGLYNGFLAAGLLWSVIQPDPLFAQQLAYFFLTCVIVAALWGAYSVGKKILFIQGFPALIALVLILLGL